MLDIGIRRPLFGLFSICALFLNTFSLEVSASEVQDVQDQSASPPNESVEPAGQTSTVNDPNHDIVFCDGLEARFVPQSGYLSFGIAPIVSLTCQNTPDGVLLLALRRSTCEDPSDRSCVCGTNRNGSYSYRFDQPGYEAVRFDDFSGIYRREKLPGEPLFGGEGKGPVTFGTSWTHYDVDSSTLQATFRPPLRVTLKPCRLDVQ